MQSQTSDNSGLNKLKSILFLVLSCNRTTILGCIIIWMFLARNQLSSTWANILMVLCVAPFFIGDAVNNYVLGRIRLEHQNNWEDISITDSIKEKISNYYNFYRAISIFSSYGLVTLVLFQYNKQIFPTWLLPTVATILSIHFILSMITIIKGISPVIPGYKKQGLLYRGIFIIVSLGCWYYIYAYKINGNLSLSFIFISGMLYLLICGIMHPLPARVSLIESIIRDSLISQAQAVARAKARATSEDKILNYSQNAQDIEDASIIESKSEQTEASENVTKSIESSSEGIVPDAIISDPYSCSEESEEDIISQSDAELVDVEEVIPEDKSN